MFRLKAASRAAVWLAAACVVASCSSSSDGKSLDISGVSCADLLTRTELAGYGVVQGGEFPEGPNGPKNEDFSMCGWNSGPNGRYRLMVALDRTERSNSWVGKKDAAEPIRGFRTSGGRRGGGESVTIATGPGTGSVQVWGTTRKPIRSVAQRVLANLLSRSEDR
ncbi:hypothetical protein HMPREF1486_01003 [Streptomyces sp. HPH0547]|nr:hypothetical protein HMPREF1486_01003 [Streptomyces sp. HPH0547]GHJ20282.1 hypothetical protein TPA0909_18960 [Streptomyces albus]